MLQPSLQGRLADPLPRKKAGGIKGSKGKRRRLEIAAERAAQATGMSCDGRCPNAALLRIVAASSLSPACHLFYCAACSRFSSKRLIA